MSQDNSDLTIKINMRRTVMMVLRICCLLAELDQVQVLGCCSVLIITDVAHVVGLAAHLRSLFIFISQSYQSDSIAYF